MSKHTQKAHLKVKKLDSISSLLPTVPSVAILSGLGFKEQRPAFRLPHWDIWLGRVSLSLEAFWPTALFSSFPNEVGKVNTFRRRGRRRRGLLWGAARQACGCQRAEGRLPNSCRVWVNEWTSHSVCLYGWERHRCYNHSLHCFVCCGNETYNTCFILYVQT